MQTLTISINNYSAIEVIRLLEKKKDISIIEESNINTMSLAGAATSVDEFRNWINAAEQTPTLSLEEAKLKWDIKRNQLLQHIKQD